jgi:hypothetical protein
LEIHSHTHIQPQIHYFHPINYLENDICHRNYTSVYYDLLFNFSLLLNRNSNKVTCVFQLYKSYKCVHVNRPSSFSLSRSVPQSSSQYSSVLLNQYILQWNKHRIIKIQFKHRKVNN